MTTTDNAGSGALQKPNIDREALLTKQLTESLSVHNPMEVLAKKVSVEQANLVIEKLAKTKEISPGTAARAVASLFRKGAANARAKDTMNVEVICPISGVATDITRYDVGMALFNVTSHKTLRKLAEALAPAIIKGSIAVLNSSPNVDLKGDLAGKINRKLLQEEKPPLTRKEEICCCTYAQWMADLNELAESERLKGLLELDLAGRKSGPSKFKKKVVNQPNQQNKGTEKKDAKKKVQEVTKTSEAAQAAVKRGRKAKADSKPAAKA